MQEKMEPYLEFLDRTDALARRLGKNINDLPEILGFSKSSLFGYRSGKSRISRKAWHKLAQAERAAGIAAPLAEQFRAATEPGEAEAVLKSASLVEFAELLGPGAAELILKMKLGAMEDAMHGFFLDLGALCTTTSEFLDDPGDLEKRGEAEHFLMVIEKGQIQAHRIWLTVLTSMREAVKVDNVEFDERVARKMESLKKEEQRIRSKKRKPPAPKSAPLQLVDEPPEDDRPRIARFEVPMLHAAAGPGIRADPDTVELDYDPGPGRLAVQIHGKSLEPRYRSGQVLILRDRNTLRRPLLKKGEIYLFDLDHGERTLKVYQTRRATAAEARTELSYVSANDGRVKVRVLQSINPDQPEILLDPDADPTWLAYLDPADPQPLLSGPGRAQQRR